MKKFLFFLLIILCIPVCLVNADDFSDLPSELMTNEGVTLYRSDDVYYAVVDSTVYSLNIDLNFGDDYIVKGSSLMIVDDEYTDHKVRLFKRSDEVDDCFDESCGNGTIVTIRTYRITHDGEGAGLSSLNVLGFEIGFNPNVYNYYVEVPENYTSLYIDAVTNSPSSVLTGAGIVKLDKKKTNVVVKVVNEMYGEKEYRITIKKKAINTGYIIAIVVLVLLFIAYVIYSKKGNVKTITKEDLKDSIDKEKIMKGVIVNPEDSKKEEDVSTKEITVEESVDVTPTEAVEVKEEVVEAPIINESIGAGTVAPRPMILPDDNN